MALKSERPDVDQKRQDLIKLQGECKVKMRELEDSLLKALAEVQGSILEDDKVIATMEKLKVSGNKIAKDLAATHEVLFLNFYFSFFFSNIFFIFPRWY